MKKLLATMILLGLSSFASAEPEQNPKYDAFVGGTFASLSNYCGNHVEKSEGSLFITAVANPRTNMRCIDQGYTIQYICKTANEVCKVNVVDQNDVKIGEYHIRFMDDGNYIQETYTRDGVGGFVLHERIKFVRW